MRTAEDLLTDLLEVPIGVILGLYWDYIGIMENEMETIIFAVIIMENQTLDGGNLAPPRAAKVLRIKGGA